MSRALPAPSSSAALPAAASGPAPSPAAAPPDHSSAIAAVDAQGDMAVGVHTINALTFGEGLFMDGTRSRPP
jgi:hypothetical protein